jgi:50S ribosomal subunit-associated GTPase HflX
LGISLGNVLYVMNKADRVDLQSINEAIQVLELPDKGNKYVIISAKTGMNVEGLLKSLETAARYWQV